MAIIPKKCRFQLRFRNKTKTRKIFSRNFRLQELLKKKHLNNSSCFSNSFVKKEQEKNLPRNPQLISPSTIRSQEATMNAGCFNKSLEDNQLNCGLPEMYHNKRGLISKEKTNILLCRPSWFLTNRIKSNNDNHIKLKKVEMSNIQFGKMDLDVLRLQKCLSMDLLSNKNKLSNSYLKSNCIFFKKKGSYQTAKAKKLLFGRYGICFKQYSIISSKFVETVKLDIAKSLRKKGRFWIRICCDTPYSARPAETRMGKGKGSISYWAAKVTPGQLFLEFSGVRLEQLKEIYQKLRKKSAISLKMLY